MNSIPIDREQRLCLDEQGWVRSGSEPRERALAQKEFAMPTRGIAMDAMEEAQWLRHECGLLAGAGN